MASHLGHANRIQRPWEAVAPIHCDYDKLWFVACVTFDEIPDADDRVNANHPIQLWNNMVYLPLACMDDDGIYVNSYDPNLPMVRKDNEAAQSPLHSVNQPTNQPTEQSKTKLLGLTVPQYFSTYAEFRAQVHNAYGKKD
uniref:Uncharacterized protein n=1 Tax=Glossina pallidipes TaxID=7398 RepID=A0A1A9ZCX4_GLOPL